MRKPYKEDLTGMRFNRLVVIEYSHNRNSHSYWLFRCDCGTEKILRANIVKNGSTKSCGCFHVDRITSHGQSEHPLYTCWNAMMQRCYNEKQGAYPDYGGRGIGVCERWRNAHGLANFIEDMYDLYQEGLTLERKLVNEDYSPQNCEWATYGKQAYNRRKPRNNLSGKTGVCYLENKPNLNWHAYIYKDSKKINLGRFASFEEAVAAREVAEIKYFGFNKE